MTMLDKAFMEQQDVNLNWMYSCLCLLCLFMIVLLMFVNGLVCEIVYVFII